MFAYLQKILNKRKQKRTFQEYGTTLKNFDTNLGEVKYAQWQHPFEQEKIISNAHISFYKNMCTNGSFIIDIGAHTGDTTVPMALAVGKNGLVLALEPNKYVYKILQENANLNTALTNIKPVCFAATDADGAFTFNYSDASFCNGGFLTQIQNQEHKHNYELEVQGKNLQNYLLANYQHELQNLSLIKIDAEGYDKEILKTLPQIITTYKPKLMIECYTKLNAQERDELFDVVTNYGYTLYKLENFEDFESKIKLNKNNMHEQKHFEMLAIAE